MSDELDCRLMTRKQVCEALGNCSAMCLWRYVQDKSLNFPQPIAIVGRDLWRTRDIAAWIAVQATKPVKRKRPGKSSGEAA